MEQFRIYAFADEAGPDIDAQIVAMKRNGLDGLEIRNVDGQNVSDISLEKAAEVRGKMDAAGLTVWSVGSPIGKVDIEKDDIPTHLEKLRHTLEVAKVLGAKNIRLFSFYIPEGKDPEDYRDRVLAAMQQVVALCDEYGVAACHENEKGIYGDTPQRCRVLLDALPTLRCIFDFANFVQCHVDTLSAWEELKDRVYYMHIKDSREDGTVVPAGKGAGNIAAIVREYAAAGGNGFTIEPHLSVFAGFSHLERAGDKSVIGENAYPDSNTAFDAACGAFAAIRDGIMADTGAQ